MTEADAKQRWCPFARSEYGDHAVNREPNGSPDRGALCLASACMAWRTSPLDPDDGYCGLAGEPRALIVRHDEDC